MLANQPKYDSHYSRMQMTTKSDMPIFRVLKQGGKLTIFLGVVLAVQMCIELVKLEFRRIFDVCLLFFEKRAPEELL